MGKLDGKVALITGGARGMGASHVRRFVAEGAQVVFGDVLADDGRTLAKELGGDCRFVPHDVTDEAAWIEIVAQTMSAFGRLDILVNNAGILRIQTVDEMTVADFRQILEVNLVSQWLGLKHAGAVMSEGGAIVNISSVNATVGSSGMTGYGASKAGVVGLTKSAALELGKRRIRVNSVHPGGVATPMIGMTADDTQKEYTRGVMSRQAIPRFAAPQEATNVVLFLASDEASYCSGAEFVVDGGMTASAGY